MKISSHNTWVCLFLLCIVPTARCYQAADLQDPNFNILSMSDKSSRRFATDILMANIPKTLTEQATLKAREMVQFFVFSSFQKYKTKTKDDPRYGPYHNFWHGVSVLQMANLLFEGLKPEIKRHISRNDKFCLLLAAFDHDIDHPAQNVKEKEALQAKYKDDISPLEQHHVAVTTSLLHSSRPTKKKNQNKSPFHTILDLLSKPNAKNKANQNRCLALVREVIMATDLKYHKQYADQIDALIAGNPNFNDNATKMTLMSFIVKAGDLSNFARTFEIALEWSRRNDEEMHADNNMPAKNTVDFFYSHFVVTTWTKMNGFLSDGRFITAVNNNLKLYQRESKKEQKRSHG